MAVAISLLMMFQDDLLHELSELRYEVKELRRALLFMQVTFIVGVLWVVHCTGDSVRPVT